MAKNRTCICCSTKYSYCPSCSNADKLKPSYFSQFCSEDCKDLWQTLTRFNMGAVEKQEAKEIVSILNLKDKSEYAACVQRDLNKIFAEEPKIKRGKRAEISPIDEVSEPVLEFNADESDGVHEVVTEEE